MVAPTSRTTPKKAPQVEAEGDETIDVTFQGNTYAFGADPDDLDGDVIDALEEGKLSLALRAMLGPDQWATFKATKPKVRDYRGLVDAWAEAVGHGTAGE